MGLQFQLNFPPSNFHSFDDFFTQSQVVIFNPKSYLQTTNQRFPGKWILPTYNKGQKTLI